MKKVLFALILPFFFIACGSDDNNVATTPQNCFAAGNPNACQNQYWHQGQYHPYQSRYQVYNGYYYGYQGSAFNNIAGCPPNHMPVANPSLGLDCIPNNSYSAGANPYYVHFQNYSLPQSCMVHGQCPSSLRCINQGPHTIGYCAR